MDEFLEFSRQQFQASESRIDTDCVVHEAGRILEMRLTLISIGGKSQGLFSVLKGVWKINKLMAGLQSWLDGKFLGTQVKSTDIARVYSLLMERARKNVGSVQIEEIIC